MSNLENRVAAIEQDVHKLATILDRELDAHRMALKIMFTVAFEKRDFKYVNESIDIARGVFEEDGKPSAVRAAQILDALRLELPSGEDNTEG